MLNETVINFFSSKKEYRTLSNFWEKDVIISKDEIITNYESGEHCFHGEKYFRIGNVCKNTERKQLLLDYAKSFMNPSPYKSPAEAKRKGGKKGLLLDIYELQLWETISIDVQKEICEWKYNSYKEVRDDLIKSDKKILIHPAMRCSEEKVKKCIWEGRAINKDGNVIILGKNKLGNIWMELRDRYL